MAPTVPIDPPPTNPSSVGEDTSSAEVDFEASGHTALLELAEAMEAIGRASSSEVLEQIRGVSAEHAAQLEQVLENIPVATLRPVLECILQLCDPIAGLSTPEAAELCLIVRHLGVDPRSYREAARSFRVLANRLVPGSRLDTVVGRAIRVLDEHGVLGRRRLLAFARFLIGVDRRPGALVLINGTLHVADEDLRLVDLVDYNTALHRHSPMWGPKAASMVLYTDTHRYGAQDALTKVKTPLARTLTVDHPSVALLPGRTTHRRWLRVDPIPQALKSADPAADMAPYVELRPGGAWNAPDLQPTLDAVYAGVRVAMSIVQPLWLNRLRLGIRLVDEPGNRACYIAEDAEIRVWRGPLSAWSTVHEMAHAIDDVLFDGPGMASEQPGNPLNAFTTLVRPNYRDVAERRARAIWQGMLKAGLGVELRRRTLQGLVPLDEVIAGLPWVTEGERAGVRSLVESEIEISPSDVHRVLGEGRPMHGGELPLLEVLQHSVVEDDQGQIWINIELGWDLFRHAEMNYLLSNREIFARFFDQYARLYLAQLGAPYGPTARPGDLQPTELAALVPRFHEAMVEAQVLDLGHISRFTGRQLQEDTVLSVGIAAGLTLLGAGFMT